MRVLMCNSFFYLRGGVERCFFDSLEILSTHGHEVIPFCMQHKRNYPSDYSRYFVSEIDFPPMLQLKTSLGTKLKTVERVIYSREAKRKITQLINNTKPDIAHVHEIEHEISPSILPVIKQSGIPIVQTLHDYKQLCPNTNFVSNGEVCEQCRRYRYYPVVLRRCKRDSFSASLLACVETYFQKLTRIYEKNVATFIVPSRFLQGKLTEHGFNGRIKIVPNPVDVEHFSPHYETSDYFVYFGRLVSLKGVKTLFEAMRQVTAPSHLYVVGEGELEGFLKEYAQQYGISHITFTGYLTTQGLIPIVQRAAFTVFPSECYENYPMTILESFACGTPVIGSNIGGIPELVKDNQNGLLFEPGNSRQLAERIQFLLDNPQRAVEMGQNGRRQVEATNHPHYYHQRITEIYQRVLQEADSERHYTHGHTEKERHGFPQL